MYDSDEPRTVTEWRVTGEPGPIVVRGEQVGTYPPYEHVWPDDRRYDETGRPNRGDDPEFPLVLTAEQAARRFVDRLVERTANGVRSRWPVGPTLTRRTVVFSAWEHVDAGQVTT